MSNYVRAKTWIAEKLFAADLNAEFDAVLAAVNNIDTQQIVDRAVTQTKIALLGVGTPEIKDDAITTQKILAGELIDVYQSQRISATETDVPKDTTAVVTTLALTGVPASSNILVGTWIQAKKESQAKIFITVDRDDDGDAIFEDLEWMKSAPTESLASPYLATPRYSQQRIDTNVIAGNRGYRLRFKTTDEDVFSVGQYADYGLWAVVFKR